jgi:hypothetical protein
MLGRAGDARFVSICLYATQTSTATVHAGGRICWRHACADRLCRSGREARPSRLAAICHSLFLAVSALHSYRLDVSRRLRSRWMHGFAFGNDEESLCQLALLPALALVPVGLIPTITGAARPVCSVAILALGAILVYYGANFAFQRSNVSSRRLLAASIIYLPAVFVLISLNKK